MLSDKLLHSIATTYNQHDNLELEAKFGHSGVNGHRPDIPYAYYERILRYLQNTVPESDQSIEVSCVRQSDTIRHITTSPNGQGKFYTQWQSKTKIRDLDDLLYSYNIRISLNQEKDLTLSEEEMKNFKPKTLRDRTRHSFLLEDGALRIDLTQVMMTTVEPSKYQYRDQCSLTEKQARHIYEAELEFLGPIEKLSLFDEYTEKVFKWLRDTPYIYTNTVRSKLIEDVTSIFGESRPMINKKILSEARNIKQRDLVYGGIVGFPGTKDFVDKRTKKVVRGDPPTNYIVTFKADGLRKMLIIHTTGIWLVFPPYEFSLIIPADAEILAYYNLEPNLLTRYNGTIFDGEYIPPANRKPGAPESLYWYLAFDCIARMRDPRIQYSNYFPEDKKLNRRGTVELISNKIKTDLLWIDLKEAQEFTTPLEFFSSVTDYLNRRMSLPYDQDGLMFFPAQYKYNPLENKSLFLNQRSLTRHPDICKWKERKDITIDFSLLWRMEPDPYRTGSYRQVLDIQSFDKQSKSLVPFRGDSRFNPFTLDMLDMNHPETLNKPTGFVIEYEWHDPTPEHPRGLLTPRRSRPEKAGPNMLDVAIDDWNDIMNPLTEEDMKGQTIKLTRAYFNRIKEDLYRSVVNKYPQGCDLLDIGSGRGGDVSKWNNLKGKVIAVEPNSDNRQELVSRIERNNMKDRVLIVPTGGQDTSAINKAVQKFIPEGKVDVISLMLSMSFFWEQDAYLEALVKTIVENIKPGGYIIFLTIDGDALEQIFEPALGGEWSTHKKIVSADITLHPKAEPPFGRAVDFILPETIVEEQREYVVHLDDLSLRLAQYGIHLQSFNRAMKEKLLSPENLVYASMFSFGMYQNTNPELLPVIPRSTLYSPPSVPSVASKPSVASSSGPAASKPSTASSSGPVASSPSVASKPISSTLKINTPITPNSPTKSVRRIPLTIRPKLIKPIPIINPPQK